MLATDLVAEIEALIPCHDGLYAAHCQCGPEYVQFSLRGDDESDLVSQMREMLLLYIEPRREPGARLFWRYALPRIAWYPDDMDEVPRGRLQTRLTVTARPIIWFSMAEYDACRMFELERKMIGQPLNS